MCRRMAVRGSLRIGLSVVGCCQLIGAARPEEHRQPVAGIAAWEASQLQTVAYSPTGRAEARAQRQPSAGQ